MVLVWIFFTSHASPQNHTTTKYMGGYRCRSGGGVQPPGPPTPFWPTLYILNIGPNARPPRPIRLLRVDLVGPPPFRNPVSAPELYIWGILTGYYFKQAHTRHTHTCMYTYISHIHIYNYRHIWHIAHLDRYWDNSYIQNTGHKPFPGSVSHVTATTKTSARSLFLCSRARQTNRNSIPVLDTIKLTVTTVIPKSTYT